MSRNLISILLRVFLLLALSAGAYLGVNTLMNSLNEYRSPLSDHPPAPGNPLHPPGTQPITRRVVFVLIDALREDTALDVQVMPFLEQLRQQGAWASMHSRPPSYSEAGYTVLLTGAWPDLSDGHTINVEYDDIRQFTQDDLFSAARRSGFKTAISGYYWFEKLVPQTAVDASFYTPGEDAQADRQVVDAALSWLRQAETQLVLIHLDQVDYAGHHEGGPQAIGWGAAASRADDLLREIAAELDFQQDTLLVVSDHGQIDQGGHGGQDAVVLSELLVLAGAGVRPGKYADMQMVDIAPTLAALLGTNLPASSQGRVLSQMLTLPDDVSSGLPEALLAQQSQLLQIYQQQINQQVAVENEWDVVKAYQSALESARQQRLLSERLVRLPIALVVVLLPLVWLLRREKKQIFWLIGSGIIYLLVFNLYYALLLGNSYSLSSVTGINELFINIATGAFLALLAAWLFFYLTNRLYRNLPSRAVLLNLDLLLVVVYLLSLPYLLNFILNGFRVTWTLPDFLTTFVGFLSLLQVLMVALLGLLLVGLSGLIARIISRKSVASEN